MSSRERVGFFRLSDRDEASPRGVRGRRPTGVNSTTESRERKRRTEDVSLTSLVLFRFGRVLSTGSALGDRARLRPASVVSDGTGSRDALALTTSTLSSSNNANARERVLSTSIVIPLLSEGGISASSFPTSPSASEDWVLCARDRMKGLHLSFSGRSFK
ncbi:hypothetical protein GSI_02489 [Ganoderma sinense ZZ0214-1]|uniref:Uncharacterized protein n=1 Tax=Ganoderma sinense ZZ0214-1 TaxID=1077348 RepID=A0A2G8SPQ9_9APHY|nr:hypothetical protein GSI_02489 [Ganoderma sinense ZZ0214-1]